jgi:hypothetical protein
MDNEKAMAVVTFPMDQDMKEISIRVIFMVMDNWYGVMVDFMMVNSSKDSWMGKEWKCEAMGPCAMMDYGERVFPFK